MSICFKLHKICTDQLNKKNINYSFRHQLLKSCWDWTEGKFIPQLEKELFSTILNVENILGNIQKWNAMLGEKDMLLRQKLDKEAPLIADPSQLKLHQLANPPFQQNHCNS